MADFLWHLNFSPLSKFLQSSTHFKKKCMLCITFIKKLPSFGLTQGSHPMRVQEPLLYWRGSWTQLATQSQTDTTVGYISQFLLDYKLHWCWSTWPGCPCIWAVDVRTTQAVAGGVCRAEGGCNMALMQSTGGKWWQGGWQLLSVSPYLSVVVSLRVREATVIIWRICKLV